MHFARDLSLSTGTYFVAAALVSATYRYYGSYISYGTGETIVYSYRNNGGPNAPHRQWLVECLDGEALVGVQDWYSDFQRIQALWCKFLFPYKPPSKGLYPYYPSCVTRNYTLTPFCYDPRQPTTSINSFVTGLWDDDFSFFQFRATNDDVNLIKCCTTPKGYYIDYASCYFRPTHDLFGEYYDYNFMFLVYCSQGFVVTGMGRKYNIITETYNVDWIHCCRLGYGAPSVLSSPVVYGTAGFPADLARDRHVPVVIPRDYQLQYKTSTDHGQVHGQLEQSSLRSATSGAIRRAITPENSQAVVRPISLCQLAVV